MEVSRIRRLGGPARYAVGLVLASLMITGCGVLGGAPSGEEAAPPQVTSTATAEAAQDPEPGAGGTGTGTDGAGTGADGTEGDAAGDAGAGEPAAGRTVVQPGGTLTDGTAVSAELTRAGQRDRFTLDLGDAREFYITDMSGDGIRLQVFSEVDGEPIGPASISLGWEATVVKLTKAGGHRLEVFGETNVIGAYRFTIATVKVRTFPVKIGLKIGENSPSAGAGRLDVRGRVDRFEFDSDGATAVKVIGGAGACAAIELELRDAAAGDSPAVARQPFPLCGYEFDLPLTGGDGRYVLIVRSRLAKTGAYSFQLARAA